MNVLLKIASFQIRDIVRSKWVLFYAIFFFAITEGLFRLAGDGSRVMVSMVNVILLVTPLVSVIFGVMHFYNSREFIEMTLTQPIKRSALFGGLYVGLSLSLVSAFVLGAVTPFVIHGWGSSELISMALTMLFTGTALTLVFVALSFLICIINDDRGRGLGGAILLWLWFSVMYDGLILLGVYTFYKYPLERPVIALTMLNPVDLARILLLLQLDVSALMGYTGAVFERFFGSAMGTSICWLVIVLWIVAPISLALKRFDKKDF